jgi:8-amino-7-oxononanoate synthase
LITESLFSLTGKYCDLNPLFVLAKKHDAWILVDDSNAFGVQGHSGLGLASHKDAVDFLLCSVDRGCGSTGAFLASNLKMNLLRHPLTIDPRESALSYSTWGSIDAALDLIQQMEGERKQLDQRCHWLRMQLAQLKIRAHSSSHFFCFSCQEKKETDALWTSLVQRGILGEQIEACKLGIDRHIVRLIINVSHTPEDLSALLSALKEIYG